MLDDGRIVCVDVAVERRGEDPEGLRAVRELCMVVKKPAEIDHLVDHGATNSVVLRPCSSSSASPPI